MAQGARRLPLRIAAGFFAFVFWLPSLALTDLVLGLGGGRLERRLARNDGPRKRE